MILCEIIQGNSTGVKYIRRRYKNIAKLFEANLVNVHTIRYNYSDTSAKITSAKNSTCLFIIVPIFDWMYNTKFVQNSSAYDKWKYRTPCLALGRSTFLTTSAPSNKKWLYQRNSRIVLSKKKLNGSNVVLTVVSSNRPTSWSCFPNGNRIMEKGRQVSYRCTRGDESDFRGKDKHGKTCVFGPVPATRVNITSTAAKFSSRQHKHKHPLEAAAGARLPPVLWSSARETTRNPPTRGSSRPRAPVTSAHMRYHVLRTLRTCKRIRVN